MFGAQKKGVFALVNKCCLLRFVKTDRPPRGEEGTGWPQRVPLAQANDRKAAERRINL